MERCFMISMAWVMIWPSNEVKPLGSVARSRVVSGLNGIQHSVRGSRLMAEPRRVERPFQYRSLVFLLVIAVLPFAVAAVAISGRHWSPSNDQAVQLFRIEQVGSMNTPLLGAWSRWGWNHPGPWPVYLLAPLTWLFGAVGALKSTLVLNSASVVVAVLAGWRRGGLAAASTVALLAMGIGITRGPTMMMDIWNPYVGLFPLFALGVVAWSVSDRDWLFLPVMAALGSFCVQAHLGQLPVVMAVCAAAIVLSVRSRNSARVLSDVRIAERRPVRRPVIASSIVLVIAWLPPLIEQFTGEQGNLSSIAAYVLEPSGQAAGWEIALRVFATEVNPNPAASVGRFDASVSPSMLVPSLMLFAAAVLGFISYRVGLRSAARLCAVALVGLLAALVATSRITGMVHNYLLVYWWSLVPMLWLSILWSIQSLLARSAPTAARAVTSVFVLVVGAGAAVLSVQSFSPQLPVEREGRAVHTLSEAIREEIDPEPSYLFDWHDRGGFGAIPVGLYFDLLRDGYDVVVPATRRASWRQFDDEHRREDAEYVLMVNNFAEDPRVPQRPGSRVIATYDPLSSAERALADSLWASIVEQVQDDELYPNALGGLVMRRQVLEAGVDPDILDHFLELYARGSGFVVHLAPGGGDRR